MGRWFDGRWDGVGQMGIQGKRSADAGREMGEMHTCGVFFGSTNGSEKAYAGPVRQTCLTADV